MALAVRQHMSASFSERILGLYFKPEPSHTVGDLVERLREKEEGERRVIVGKPSDTVADAHKLFQSFDLHHLPIVSGVKVVGIVSSSDLLKFFSREHEAADTCLLKDLMTPEPTIIEKTAPIADVIHLLAQSRFRCVPVVNPTQEIWDIVTTRDLVRFLELSYN